MFKQKKAKRSNGTTSYWKWKPFKHLKALSTFYVKAKMMVNVNNPNFVLASHHAAGKFTAMQLDPSWSQSRCAVSSASSSAAATGGPHKAAANKSGEVMLESAVQAIKTKRLFFDPGSTNSILGSARFVFQDCVVQAIETSNPYVEFRVSMEEMVAAYGLIKSGASGGEKDYYWDYLEGLLSWYLRMNEKKNHGVIVEAFIDMYTAIPSCPSSCSFSYNANSASSSKSKEWWEIKINETYLRAEKEMCPKYF